MVKGQEPSEPAFSPAAPLGKYKFPQIKMMRDKIKTKQTSAITM